MDSSKVNMQHCCRICMADNRAMLDIFHLNNRNMPKEIHYCSGVNIKQEDNLPPFICIQCLNDLSIAFNFKTKCTTSDLAFKSLSIKQEIEMNKRKENVDDCGDGSSKIKPRPLNVKIKTQFIRLPGKSFEIQKHSENMINKPQKVNCSEELKKSSVTLTKNKANLCQAIDNTALPKDSNSLTKTTDKPELNMSSTIKNYIIKKEIRKVSHAVSNIPVEFNSKQDLNQEKDINTPLNKFKIEKISENRMPLDPGGTHRRPYCKICKISFDNRKSLRRHQRTEHKPEPCTCEICGKLFSTPASLPGHMKTHGEPQFYCDICNYNTFHKHCLQRHMNVHTGQYKYTCEYCQRQFSFKSNVRTHIRRVHLKNEEKKFSCPTCNRRFAARNTMERHYKVHLQIRSYDCEKCPSSFVHYSNYKRHMLQVHSVLLKLLKPGRKRSNPVKTESDITSVLSLTNCAKN